MQLLLLATGDSGMVSVRLGRVCRRPTADFLKDAFISLFLRKPLSLTEGTDATGRKESFGPIMKDQVWSLPFVPWPGDWTVPCW